MTNPILYRGKLGKLPEGYEWESWNLPDNCRGTLHLGMKELPLFCSPLIQNPNFLKNFLDLADSQLRKLAEAGVDVLQLFKICAAHTPYKENTSIRKFEGEGDLLLQCAETLKSAAAAIRKLGDATAISTYDLREALQQILDVEDQPFRRSLDDPVTLKMPNGKEIEYYPVNADWLAGSAIKAQNPRTRKRHGSARPLLVQLRLFRPEWPEQFDEAALRLSFLAKHVLRKPKHRPQEKAQNSFILSAAALCKKATGKPMDEVCFKLFQVTFDICDLVSPGNENGFDAYRVRRRRLEKKKRIT